MRTLSDKTHPVSKAVEVAAGEVNRVEAAEEVGIVAGRELSSTLCCVVTP